MSGAVEVKTNVKFKPWLAPNFAVLDLGEPTSPQTSEAPAIAVKDLTDEALSAMAERWLEDLYNKADKRSPFQLPLTP